MDGFAAIQDLFDFAPRPLGRILLKAVKNVTTVRLLPWPRKSNGPLSICPHTQIWW